MQQYWKEHEILRGVLIAALFAAALALVIAGWKMTGQLAGLGLMVVGVICLLAALAVYNSPFTEPKSRKKKETEA
ncbi:MAG: hypothetical protein Q4C82_04465 [Eubacteriales bacterium]|nr:hypothetical protein [Eubacteriales bacterium]